MNKEIPPQIKRWNWGAFLLTPLWCIRHRVWFGLLIFVPFFGLIIPFILGAKGNQKAWLKNPQEPIDKFLKRQKKWGFAGLAVWTALCITSFVLINFSTEIEMGLETANSNKRLTAYFGKPIKKSSLFEGTFNHTLSDLFVAFDATGDQNSGTIHFQWEKRGNDWVATDISYVTAEGETKRIVDSPVLDSSFFAAMPYKKANLEKVLDRMIEEKEGFAILSRSKENNDFMQTAASTTDDGSVVFSVVYSDGFTESNKQIYQAKNQLHNKEEILKLFALYATGSDSHIGQVEWNKLISITPVDGDIVSFTFS